MRSGPRLSIGMPVFNGERFIAEAITSLLQQTYADFEIVVLDNASTDTTPEIVARLMASDSRIRYQRNETNIGASPNFAKVASLTSAPFFKWAAHDDLHEPSYLAESMRTLEANPDVVLAHADIVYIGPCGRNFAPGRPGTFVDPDSGVELPVDRVDLAERGTPLSRFADVIFHSRIGSHMFGVVRRSALDRTRSIQDIPSSDRPFLAELALLGPFKQTRAPLFRKRFHPAMTWALTGDEERAYVSGSSARYSPRARKLRVYLTAAFGKPVSAMTKVGCCAVVLGYSAKVAVGRHLGAGRRRNIGSANSGAAKRPPSSHVQVL
ncbi:MAG: glycosyltransferase family 2 protein [Hyphomicrobiaceae bacterium]